jgi:hypothetical protein
MIQVSTLIDMLSPYIAAGMAGVFLGMAIMSLVASNRAVMRYRYKWALYRITDICRREQFRSPFTIKIQRTAEEGLGEYRDWELSGVQPPVTEE